MRVSIFLKLSCLLIIILFASSARASTEMSIITTKGSVSFTAGDNWKVIAMQSKLPIAVAGFQIPNPADEGTPDSTNLVISLIQPDSDKALKALAVVGHKYGDLPVVKKTSNGWEIYTQDAKQKDTLYTIVDAKKDIADVIVTVRFTWPHLANNPSEYAQKMNSTFDDFLESIHGKIGSYQPRDGETIRRPAP